MVSFACACAGAGTAQVGWQPGSLCEQRERSFTFDPAVLPVNHFLVRLAATQHVLKLLPAPPGPAQPVDSFTMCCRPESWAGCAVWKQGRTSLQHIRTSASTAGVVPDHGQVQAAACRALQQRTGTYAVALGSRRFLFSRAARGTTIAGTITALRIQKRNAERVNVYLDGQYALALPILAAAKLRRGQSLSDEDIAYLKALNEEAKAYDRAVRFLAHRPRSIAETQNYLRRHQLPDSAIDQVIQRLVTAGYLDDTLFAQFWVEDRERFRPRGPAALRYELRQKGLPEPIIDSALQDLDAEDSAYRAAVARAPRLTGLDRATFRQKLGSYLLRRGFGHDVVWPVVDRTWEELQGSDPGAGWSDE